MRRRLLYPTTGAPPPVVVPPAIVQAAGGVNITSAAPNVTLPAPPTNGDLLIATVSAGVAGTPNTPPGWTLCAAPFLNNKWSAIAYKIAAGDPALFSWPLAASANAAVAVYEISGSPLPTFDSVTNTTTATAALTLGPTAQSNALGVAIGCACIGSTATTFTADNGFTIDTVGPCTLLAVSKVLAGGPAAITCNTTTSLVGTGSGTLATFKQ